MAPNIQILTQVKTVWGRLTKKQQMLVVGFFVAVMAFAALIVFLVNQTDYAVLFSGLNAEDSGAIVTKLKEMKVDFRVSQDGSVIEAPSDKVGELRLEMASEGVVGKGNVGFEVFDKNTFGVTDFTQKVNLRRALEGELARTISHMKEVRSVRVHLVIPEDKLFKEDQEKAKASVVLALKPNVTLTKKQILGITNLVASAVPGLAPESVAVVDNAGALISNQFKESELESGNRANAEYRQNLEREYKQAVLGLLEPVVGSGRVKAEVAITLDMNRVEQTSEVYDPNKTAVAQSQKSEEFLNLAGGGAGGIAGTRSNSVNVTSTQPVTGTAAPLASAGNEGKIRNQESMTYQVSRVVRREQLNVGDIKRATVAVVVDNRLRPAKGGKGQPESVPWTAKELEDMRSLVAASIGIDAARGDLITIVNAPFLSEEIEEKPLSFWDRYQHLLPVVIKWIGIVFVCLVLYMLLIRPIKRRVGKVLEVLVEGPSEKDASVMAGRSRTNKMVHWPDDGTSRRGERVGILIEKARTFVLHGRKA